MNMVLACTGYPQRELSRFRRLLPQLAKVYETIILSVPPNMTSDELGILESSPNVIVFSNQDWSQGRYSAIQKALETSAKYIHYADLDRVLHWIETNSEELREVVLGIEKTDCLVIGRTKKAFETHPNALRQTEKIINIVFSNLLGQSVDLGGGSRGFSRRAAEFLIGNSNNSSSWCTDSEWVMLLYHAGYHVDYIEVNGLESPNYPTTYDTDVNHWIFRVQVAQDIIQAGISVSRNLFRK
jgi:hypothetical protein